MNLDFSQGIDPRIDPRATASPPTKELASWYTPGLVDGFGDRLLMFDNTDSEPLEVLRFHAAVAATPGFEEVLLERVTQVARMTHPAFPSIRAVERLETDRSLALISTHTPGLPLSAFFAEPRLRKCLSPAFVTAVVSQVIECLSVLQAEGDAIAHNALTADRVILTSGARVRVTEHVLGSALRQLHLSPSQLWREFGLMVPREGGCSAQLDTRADVFQVGVLALSMLLARRLTPDDIEGRLPHLLDQWSDAMTRSGLGGEMLRRWLDRALQVGERPYGSAAEAYQDLIELPTESVPGPFESLHTGDSEGPPKPLVIVRPTAPARGQDGHTPNGFLIDQVRDNGSTQTSVASAVPEGRTVKAIEMSPPELQSPRRGSPLLVLRINSRTVPSWAAIALTAIALIEGLVIAMLMMRLSASATSTAPAAFGSAEVQGVRAREVPPAPPLPDASRDSDTVLAVSDASRLPRATTAPDGSLRNQDAVAIAIERAASNQRSGGVRLSAPIELKVLQGDRVLGSSADGPVVMTAGTYQLELINPALGFRAQQSVTFHAGQIATLTIPVPRGRISVNAQPWAEVWIDDRLIGDTPLANLDIPIGEHEVVFRHPQLGERRQGVVVRADAPARVSTTFDR